MWNEIIALIDEFFQVEGYSYWGFQVFAVVFVTLVLGYLLSTILKIIHHKCSKTKNKIDDILLASLRKPLVLLVWIFGLMLALRVMRNQLELGLMEVLLPVFHVAIVADLAWFLNRFIKKMQNHIIETKHLGHKYTVELDQTTIDAVGKILRAAVIVTAALVALQTLGFNIGGVLAFGGVGGLVIGFAAKDLLSNFFGALMIYFDRPFVVGEWIRSPDKEIEGVVEDIGWRQTRIRTFDKRPLYVPNSLFSTIVVENPSRMTNRRLFETIGVRYDDMDKVAVIVEKVKTLLTSHNDIDQDQIIMVHVNEFAASSVDFFIYALTKTTVWAEYHHVKQEVLLDIAGIIEEAGAEIAYPTSTLHIPEGVFVQDAKTLVKQ